MGELIVFPVKHEGVGVLQDENVHIEDQAASNGIVVGNEELFLGRSVALESLLILDAPDRPPHRKRRYLGLVRDLPAGDYAVSVNGAAELGADVDAAQEIGNVAVGGETASRTKETVPVSDEDRVLTEVHHLNRHRQPDGQHSTWAYKEVLKNQITAVKEAAIPHAVSKVFQERVLTGELDRRGRPVGFYMWLGRTAVEVAKSGYAFHRRAEARERVAVEVDEARHNDKTMREGYAKVFLSPRDPNLRDEHLGDDDAIRISYLGKNEAGEKGKILESILVKDIPLDALIMMLKDPNNIWGKSISMRENTPLGVMRAHRELELPLDRLPEGVISLVEAVVPYIADAKARESVERQLVLLRGDQGAIDKHAKSVAERWMQFEVSLADSLYTKRATPEITMFINQLQSQWSESDIALFESHRLADGGLRMTKKLAARLENAKRNLLWTAAAVVTGNERVLKQMDQATVDGIRKRELLIQRMTNAGISIEQIMAIEVKNNQTIAKQNIKVGAGCPGEVDGGFRTTNPEGNVGLEGSEGSGENRKDWVKTKGPCRIESCPNHSKRVWVGPCGVCMDRCQKIYDNGGDPTKTTSMLDSVLDQQESKKAA